MVITFKAPSALLCPKAIKVLSESESNYEPSNSAYKHERQLDAPRSFRYGGRIYMSLILILVGLCFCSGLCFYYVYLYRACLCVCVCKVTCVCF